MDPLDADARIDPTVALTSAVMALTTLRAWEVRGMANREEVEEQERYVTDCWERARAISRTTADRIVGTVRPVC